jgi:SulP family sulfate permease
MTLSAPRRSVEPAPSFAELYTPKLVTILREGYTARHLRFDLMAGLTVAIVALPLSMAIAIASGASPVQGLYTAIVGGFVVSALGGSRFQIAGPAGAFIVLVGATVHAHGIDGLVLATVLSGFMLVLVGLLRLGGYIKFIPYPVTVGFTAGIAVIIFASQIRDFFGLAVADKEPVALLEKLPVLWDAWPTLDPWSTAIAGGTVVAILGLQKFRPRWPGMLIAIAGAAAFVALVEPPVATIGSRFGGIPQALPLPTLPDFALDKVKAVLPNALAFALLGSIESLLSAVIADGMTGRRHRSNCELVAQGLANVASGLFGGFCVTGTIARTATAVRAGAHGPMTGMFHAVFLAIFVLVAAPLARHIPLASLAGLLVVVSWSMVERQAFASLLRASPGDAAVLLTTFLLTMFRDLTEAIVVGFALGSALFIHRMSKTTAGESHMPLVAEDRADDAGRARRPYDEAAAKDPNVVVYRIAGAFFFGAAGSIGAVLEGMADRHRVLIVDFSAVPFLDSTAANTIRGLARKAQRRGVKVMLSGTDHAMRLELFAQEVKPPLVAYETSVDRALLAARRFLAGRD